MPSMPNIASVLKSEIARVARKEIREQLAPLQKAIADQKKHITTLKRQLVEQQKALRRLQSGGRMTTPRGAAEESKDSPALRWRPAGFAQHRKRLGLSAEQMAKLLGCSSLSIYKWESGKVRPRQAQLEAIARVRNLSRAQAHEQLQGAAS